jgi:hypothetical protein
MGMPEQRFPGQAAGTFEHHPAPGALEPEPVANIADVLRYMLLSDGLPCLRKLTAAWPSLLSLVADCRGGVIFSFAPNNRLFAARSRQTRRFRSAPRPSLRHTSPSLRPQPTRPAPFFVRNPHPRLPPTN